RRHRQRCTGSGTSRGDARGSRRPRARIELSRGRRRQLAARALAGMRSLLEGELQPVSVGAPLFAETLEQQGVDVGRVEWQPPADGDAELASILTRSWVATIDQANQVALRKVL